jgi:hypothetical protein
MADFSFASSWPSLLWLNETDPLNATGALGAEALELAAELGGVAAAGVDPPELDEHAASSDNAATAPRAVRERFLFFMCLCPS